jgi:hypothetical protein
MKAKKMMAKGGSLKKAKMGMGVYGSGSDMSSSMMAKGGSKKSKTMYRKGGATSKMKKGGC